MRRMSKQGHAQTSARRSMRIIHCADLHLDSKMTANLSKEQARDRKGEILRTFGRMVEYAKISEEVAEKYGAKYIDLQSEFDAHLRYRYPAYISWDRVHPGWVGSMIIARKILTEIGAKPLY